MPLPARTRLVCFSLVFTTCVPAFAAGGRGQRPPRAAEPAATRVAPAVPIRARPIPLSDVRLTGGPLKRAEDLDAAYLLSLETDRLVAFLRKSAGLATRAEGYAGWDGPGRQLTGHIAGHYLSAVSLMFAATGDARFKARADALVRELAAVQDAQGDGYIGAQADREGVDAKVRFRELAKGVIRSGGFDLNGLWSPWYVLHKIYAGLRDAYRFTGSRLALDVEKKYAAWAETIVGGLSDAQVQQMLATEFGGMNEVMADLYADTGNRRWLALSDRFQHRAVVDPLARHEDILAGTHGNTQVPKMLGSLVRHIYTGNAADGAAAGFFWDQVALHHSFATGGHGRNEYFGPPDALDAMIDGRTAETCNVYNMIKMARMLFALNPDVRYADFLERALFNHILGSMDPRDGATCYMVPVGQRVSREYQDMQRDFTCCVGSGMESHALHGDGLYYEGPNRLWVNAYAPSRARWRTAGARLTVDTDFPEGESVRVALTLAHPRAFTLALRRPWWAGDGFSVSINGRPLQAPAAAGRYVEISRRWRSGDVVALRLPKALHLAPLPDNTSRVAIMWGPLVLAGDLGAARHSAEEAETLNLGAPAAAPTLVSARRDPAEWVKPLPGLPARWRTAGVGRDTDVDLVPFYRLHRHVYAAYWDLLTPGEWEARRESLQAAAEARRTLEAATVAFAQLGQMQAERDVNLQGGRTSPAQLQGRFGRRAADWFSLELPVDPSHPLALVVTYNREERQARSFDLLVEGRKVGDQAFARLSPQEKGEFFDVEYQVPPDLAAGRQKVTIRFQATGGKEVAAVYGVRIVRSDARRQ
jgi:uncharacterized protein